MNKTQHKAVYMLAVLVFVSSCKLVKLGQFYMSENHQKPKQQTLPIQNNQDKTFKFHSDTEGYQEFIGKIQYQPPLYKNKKGLNYDLEEYLDKKTKTTAFLVIRRDTVLFEKYFEGYHQSSVLPSFSVAKSFTSALVGIAINEGYINSEFDLVVKYLPELKEYHQNWNLLTIEHLLNMRSGISFNEDNYVNPYSGISGLYMTKDVMKVIKNAKFNTKPGLTHYYSSMDTEILGLIVERATGVSLSEYLQDNIWQPCGMEAAATWAIDSKKTRNTKAFCCINAIARDYAKFGRLFLKKGNWQGKQVIDPLWVKKSIIPDFENNCYQYQWYSKNRGAKLSKNNTDNYELVTFSDSLSATREIENPEYEYVKKYWKDEGKWIIQKCGNMFYALGIFGQEIYIDPETEMIFVRLGKKWDTSNQRLFSLIQREIGNFKEK